MFRLGVSIAVLTLGASLVLAEPAAGRTTGKASDMPARAKALEQRARNQDAASRADTLKRSAQLWLAGGKRDQALSALSAAIETRPTDATLWLRRAELHAATGALWEAIDDATQALDIDPARVAGFTLRASLWRRLDVADMAVADLERAVELRPDAEPLRAMLATLVAPAGGTPSRRIETLGMQSGPPHVSAKEAPAPAPAPPPDRTLDHMIVASVRPSTPRSLLPPLAAQAASSTNANAGALDAITINAAKPGKPRQLVPAQPMKRVDPTALDSDMMAASRTQVRAPVPPSIPAGPPRSLAPVVAALPPTPPRTMTATDAATLAVIAPAAAPRSQAQAPAVEPAPTVPEIVARYSNAPPPRIYRGAEIPQEIGQRVGTPRGEITGGMGGPFVPPPRSLGTGSRGNDAARAPGARVTTVPPPAKPILPPRKRAAKPKTVAMKMPASFDATPADPMREDLVAVPRVRVEQQKLP